LKTHNNCPLCKSYNFKSLCSYEEHYLHRCHSCGFVFSLPVPEEEELDNLYRNYGNYGNLSSITLNRFDELLKSFAKYNVGNKILDFGCGEGFFLERAKLSGWQVFGTEYDKEAVKKCQSKGITMIDAEDESFYEHFDVVYISEVIEHVSFPINILSVIHKLLRKGGLIYVTTPNFNGLSRLILKNKWDEVIIYPEHLSYFTSRTLQNSLKLTGFRIIKIFTQGVNIRTLNIIRNKKIDVVKESGTTDEKIRELAEKNRLVNFAKAGTNFFLRIIKKGDTIKCAGVKL
jgi:2-polyprenyl-3-methyl-5-hydroxy-6-metoxy-1,4-benzoquinol methylase